jgi:hypothetical protein
MFSFTFANFVVMQNNETGEKMNQEELNKKILDGIKGQNYLENEKEYLRVSKGDKSISGFLKWLKDKIKNEEPKNVP